MRGLRSAALNLLLITALGAPGESQAAVTRGPYLQNATSTSVVVRWRSSAMTNSRVRFGLSTTTLTMTADDPAITGEHIVTVSGLAPATRYFYTVGSTTLQETTADINTYFTTAPSPGMASPTRIWVLGDSGQAGNDSRNVRDGYLTYSGARPADIWLMLGDNAYNSGTDTEYQAAVFNTYLTILRKTPLWSAFGNHDASSASSATQTGIYYDVFTFPTQGEAGGVPSETEAWYSFDYANLHFVSLDSTDSDRSSAGPMLTWLQQDLAANTRQWTVAFFHHPAYSKGSHDSDVEIELIEMRTQALPILEQYGVDLVLTGHSHSYERSVQVDGHYGIADSISDAMKIDPGDGQESGDGVYVKPVSGPHEGAVHVVAGSGSRLSGGALNHPAMHLSISVLGSLVLDVNGPRMDVAFVGILGNTIDSFTMHKGPGAPCAAAPAEVTPTMEISLPGYRLTWGRPIKAYASTVYVGELSPTSRVDWDLACHAQTIPAESLDLTPVPPAGFVHYYLVAGVNDCGPGSAGSGSGGAPRPALPSCH